MPKSNVNNRKYGNQGADLALMIYHRSNFEYLTPTKYSSLAFVFAAFPPPAGRAVDQRSVLRRGGAAGKHDLRRRGPEQLGREASGRVGRARDAQRGKAGQRRKDPSIDHTSIAGSPLV